MLISLSEHLISRYKIARHYTQLDKYKPLRCNGLIVFQAPIES